MLGKNQAKILLRYYEQTLSNFSITLQPSQAMIKPSKTSSFFWIFQCRKSSSTKTTDSSFYLLKTTGSSLCSYSQSHSIVFVLTLSHIQQSICQPFHHVFCLKKKKQALAFDENYIATPHQPSHLTRKNFVSGLLYLSRKMYNQVTLSNEHMNYLFRA